MQIILRTVLLPALLIVSMATAAQSTCYGSTGNGRLADGVRLPLSGDNFVSYSRVASLAGRTHVHSTVRDILLDAWASLAQSRPDTVYKYAETGWAEGGPFKPHKTHQNGLSVDFMTPVVNAEGESVHLPTHAFNRYGYDIEFDNQGRLDELRIDFDALGAHLVALHKASVDHGQAIWRVLFDPVLQPQLLATEHGDYIRRHIQLAERRSWVRHDEHYHVDFRIDCQPLR